jgi:hypothetical protein
MKIVNTDIWLSSADVVLITTNGMITNGNPGHLVMGRGVALEATKRFEGIQFISAKEIIDAKYPRIDRKQNIYLYGFHPLETQLKTTEEYLFQRLPVRLGLLQTKYHWGLNSDLALIGYSLTKLKVWMNINPNHIVALPMPGVGNGKLDRRAVLPLLEGFSDNLIIYDLGT